MNLPVFCNDWIRIDNKILCALSNANAICMIDEDSGDVEYLHSTDDAMDATLLFSAIVNFKDKVYFVPYRAMKILVYSDITKKFHDLDTGIDYKKRRDEIAFWTSYSWGDYLYMFGCGIPNYLILDMRTEKINTYSVLERNFINGSRSFFSWGCAFYDNSIYIPFGNETAVFRKSLNINFSEIVTIHAEISHILSLSGVNESIVILGEKDNILKLVLWNVALDNYKEIYICTFQDFENNRVFFPPIVYEGKAYIFPCSNIDRYYVVDINNQNVCENIFFKDNVFENKNICGLSYAKQRDNIIYFQKWTTVGQLGEYNIENQTIKLKGSYVLDSEKYNKKRIDRELGRLIDVGKYIDEREGYLSAFLRNLNS